MEPTVNTAPLGRKPAEKATPKKWKFAKGDGADIPSKHGGMLRVREEHLDNPAMLAAIRRIEQTTGNEIFGRVLIEEGT